VDPTTVNSFLNFNSGPSNGEKLYGSLQEDAAKSTEDGANGAIGDQARERRGEQRRQKQPQPKPTIPNKYHSP
jgi:hypothetical protein